MSLDVLGWRQSVETNWLFALGCSRYFRGAKGDTYFRRDAKCTALSELAKDVGRPPRPCSCG